MDNNKLSELSEMVKGKKETAASIMAQIIMDELKPFVHDGNMYAYSDGVYRVRLQKDLLTDIYSVIPKGILGKFSMRAKDDAVKSVFAMCPRIDTLPKYPTLLNCKNGVFDIESNTLLKHNPEYRMIYQLQVNYIPDAKAEKFYRILQRIYA